MSSTGPRSLSEAIEAGEEAQKILSAALVEAKAAASVSGSSSVSTSSASSTAASSNLPLPASSTAASSNLPTASTSSTVVPSFRMGAKRGVTQSLYSPSTAAGILKPKNKSIQSLGKQTRRVQGAMNLDKTDELREANKDLPPGWHAEFNPITDLIRWVDASNPPNIIEYMAKPDINGVLPDYAKIGFNRFRGSGGRRTKKRSRKGQKKTRTSGKVKI